MKYSNIREEELKKRLAQDFFCNFDCTENIKGVGFAVKRKREDNAVQELDTGRFEVIEKWSTGEFAGCLSFDDRYKKEQKDFYWISIDNRVVPELREKFFTILEQLDNHIKKIFPQVGKTNSFPYGDEYFVTYNAGYINKETAEKINNEAKQFLSAINL